MRIDEHFFPAPISLRMALRCNLTDTFHRVPTTIRRTVLSVSDPELITRGLCLEGRTGGAVPAAALRRSGCRDPEGPGGETGILAASGGLGYIRNRSVAPASGAARTAASRPPPARQSRRIPAVRSRGAGYVSGWLSSAIREPAVSPSLNLTDTAGDK